MTDDELEATCTVLLGLGCLVLLCLIAVVVALIVVAARFVLG